MWSRLTRRLRRRTPARLDAAAEELAALERLGELVGRIVALLPEAAAAPDLTPALPPQPAPTAAVATLLFVPSPSGYRLADAEAGVARGERVDLAEGAFRVLRLGPSPLPGDPRRCAFLEREEPRSAARTSDA